VSIWLDFGTSSTGANFTWVPVQEDRPYRVGDGPPTFSTCTALAPMIPVVLDVNGYYRALGVDWRASRKELREAYQRLDGQCSEYLTYVIKQLLDPAFRAVYNRLKLGQLIIDKYLQLQLRKQLRERVPKSMLPNIDVLEERLLRRMGAVPIRHETPEPQGNPDLGNRHEQPPKKAPSFLDSRRAAVHDDEASPDSGYPYSHYVLRSTAGDRTLLPEWQRLVIEACRAQEIEVSIALGFHHVDERPWLVQQVGYHTVIFFHDSRSPDPIYAADAVTFIALIEQRTTAA
jgi:hypothetical protein